MPRLLRQTTIVILIMIYAFIPVDINAASILRVYLQYRLLIMYAITIVTAFEFGLAIYDQFPGTVPSVFNKLKPKTSKTPKVVVWDGDDDIDDFDFADIDFDDLDESKILYVPEHIFSKTEIKPISETYVREIVNKITDTLSKKSISLRFKNYNASQQVLSVFFAGEDTVNENGTVTYFDIGRVERSLPNVQTALGTKNIKFNSVAGVGEDGTISFDIAIRNSENILSLGNLYNEFSSKGLNYIVGRDTNDNTVYTDITTAPHLLYVGGTGSGKSTALRSAVAQLVTTHSEYNLELYLSDVKQVELSIFQSLPHTKMFASTHQETVEMLRSLIDNMTRRNKVLEKNQCVNIADYNAKFPDKKMAYIVCIIEEFLMLTTLDTSETIASLLQSLLAASRSSGIHVILASQSANAEVLKTTLRTNIPVKVVFKLSNKSENTVVSTENGHMLSGNGDCILSAGGTQTRIQSPLIEPDEMRKIVEYLR